MIKLNAHVVSSTQIQNILNLEKSRPNYNKLLASIKKLIKLNKIQSAGKKFDTRYYIE